MPKPTPEKLSKPFMKQVAPLYSDAMLAPQTGAGWYEQQIHSVITSDAHLARTADAQNIAASRGVHEEPRLVHSIAPLILKHHNLTPDSDAGKRMIADMDVAFKTGDRTAAIPYFDAFFAELNKVDMTQQFAAFDNSVNSQNPQGLANAINDLTLVNEAFLMVNNIETFDPDYYNSPGVRAIVGSDRFTENRNLSVCTSDCTKNIAALTGYKAPGIQNHFKVADGFATADEFIDSAAFEVNSENALTTVDTAYNAFASAKTAAASNNKDEITFAPYGNRFVGNIVEVRGALNSGNITESAKNGAYTCGLMFDDTFGESSFTGMKYRNPTVAKNDGINLLDHIFVDGKPLTQRFPLPGNLKNAEREQQEEWYKMKCGAEMLSGEHHFDFLKVQTNEKGVKKPVLMPVNLNLHDVYHMAGGAERARGGTELTEKQNANNKPLGFFDRRSANKEAEKLFNNAKKNPKPYEEYDLSKPMPSILPLEDYEREARERARTKAAKDVSDERQRLKDATADRKNRESRAATRAAIANDIAPATPRADNRERLTAKEIIAEQSEYIRNQNPIIAEQSEFVHNNRRLKSDFANNDKRPEKRTAPVPPPSNNRDISNTL